MVYCCGETGLFLWRYAMRPMMFALLAIQSMSATAAEFELTSPNVGAGKIIQQRYVYNGLGCSGGNASPALSWKNPPASTKSFAVTVFDPDSPTGGAGFWHWMVVNLPATMTGLAQGDGALHSTHLPTGASQIRTDFGVEGWRGPCPPVGAKPHHYQFTVYALKVEHLAIPADATASMAGFMINQAAIGKAGLIARYGR